MIHADRRVAEARKFGLERVLGPRPAEGKVKGLESGETLADALRAAGAKRLLERPPNRPIRPTCAGPLTKPNPSFPHGFPRNS